MPEPDGGVRLLGIPAVVDVVDRLLQQALLHILDPLYDPTFSPSICGFWPGKSAHMADPREAVGPSGGSVPGWTTGWRSKDRDPGTWPELRP